MIEGFDFTVSYAPVAGIWSLCIIISIVSAEGLIIFVLDISNDFQNTIIPDYAEMFYLGLPHLYSASWQERNQNVKFYLLDGCPGFGFFGSQELLRRASLRELVYRILWQSRPLTR